MTMRDQTDNNSAAAIGSQAAKRHNHLSRRSLLQGLSATALVAPQLLAGAKAARAAGLPPRNLVLLTWPDGLEEGWHPSGDELHFKLNERLAPLEPFRKKLLILGGLKSGIS